MSGIEHQIVAAYDQGLPVEEIASQLSLDPVTVKFVLSKRSDNFRKALKENPSIISQEEQSEMAEIVKTIARTQLYENPNTALKAAAFLLRFSNEKLNHNSNNQFNIVVFNEELAKARERMAQLSSEVLDVIPQDSKS